MVKCHRNDVGSLLLDRSGGNSRPWGAFSGASFRRIIIDAVRCGGSFRRDDDNVPLPESPSRSETKKKKNGGSEKLSELLRLSESSDGGEVAAVEEMKAVVRRLQCDDVLGGAVDVRRLAKENAEARTSLALLGAIPTLVALLDSEDVETWIASLYALLNLGIGNDA